LRAEDAFESDERDDQGPAQEFSSNKLDLTMQTLAPGLYLVATPIGNLGDITLRALAVLRSVDRIACEDTRQTQKLLNHFEITTPTVSYHQHNERERADQLVESLRAGGRIAVVSDAGVPAISDPGGWLVRAAIEAGVRVVPIPGANAALSGLIGSGLRTEAFAFHGFLPEKAGERRTRLEKFVELAEAAAVSGDEPTTLIFYEAPHRILETLGDCEAVWGPELRVVVARELTKIHEEFLRGTVHAVREALAARERVRGEITLLIEPVLKKSQTTHEKLSVRVQRMMDELGVDEKEALKKLARELGQSKSELYRELQRERARR
jgi:16S rRNA (cytidine1402-2'-O)-methyltransferase